MRASSPGLTRAFAAGITHGGGDVVLIGLCSTDGLYYASGALDAPGVMFTASHNPASYNGIKLCRAGARPIGHDSGLGDIRDAAQALLDDPSWSPSGHEPRITERDLLPRVRRAPAQPGRPSAARGRSRSSWTPATAWPGSPCRPSSAPAPGCRSCR